MISGYEGWSEVSTSENCTAYKFNSIHTQYIVSHSILRFKTTTAPAFCPNVETQANSMQLSD